MKMRFLLDEHLNPRIKKAVLRRDVLIDILYVGEPKAPPLGTKDPDILKYLEINQRALITDNRRTIPYHIGDHLASERNHWGVFLIRSTISIGRLAEEIHLLWETSEAEEWINMSDRIPL